MRDLCGEALEMAAAAGATYADARVLARRAQYAATKNGRVESLQDVESEGIGVRVLVDGAWGFASDRELTVEGARSVARRAVGFASAAGGAGGRRLVPVGASSSEYRTPVERDPFAVALGDKVALCLRAEEAMGGSKVRVTSAFVRALRERKVLMTSDGIQVDQDVVECGGGIDAVAVDDGTVQMRSYPSSSIGLSAQAGWEFVESLDLVGAAPRVGEEATALLQADVCPAGRTTVVLDCDQMASQIHESVGHPTELDRVYGTEAAYAGTSFLHADDLDSLRYGSPHMNITADSTTPRGLGTFAHDDEGVAAMRQPIVAEGVLRDFLSSRETAALLGRGQGGSMRADGWSRMPLVRMTNLHLEPGSGTLEDLFADVDDGVYLETNKSWSIDDKRLNFQFGTQIAWEIKRGRLGRMLRDAVYTGITPTFWGSLDGVAGPEAWTLVGVTNCGKGQPGQTIHVSHGTAPARFRDVEVGVKP
jgi:TldD protein